MAPRSERSSHRFPSPAHRVWRPRLRAAPDDHATATPAALIASALGANVRREKETSMGRTMIAAAAVVVAVGGHAAAQEWPTRPITLIVPFAAGGGIDVSARIQAQRMGELLGQSNVIQNLGAAAGLSGGARVAKAPPDGYTLLIANTGTNAFNQSLYKQPLYDTPTVFDPVGLVSASPRIFISRKDLPADNLPQFHAHHT